MAQNEGNLQRLNWFLADNQQRNGTSVLQPQGNENTFFPLQSPPERNQAENLIQWDTLNRENLVIPA